jgi:hypothetical protein
MRESCSVMYSDYNDFEEVPQRADEPELKERFKKVYANVPLDLRSDVVAVIDDSPMSWNVCYIEVNCDTPMAERILEYLNRLELI